MRNNDVYVYGMTVLSTIHRLKGPFPPADHYQEIVETRIMPGGEAGNAAVVLGALGLRVKLDGPFLGRNTKTAIAEFFRKRNVDCSGMEYCGDYDGFQDMVFVDEGTRTVFGRFGQLLFGEKDYWARPNEEAVKRSSVVALDPFFRNTSEEAARMCVAHGKRYVTIDWPPGTFLSDQASCVVIAGEYRRGNFPGRDPKDLFDEYVKTARGLVIFTFGSRELWYSRQGGPTRTFKPFEVKAVDTLGAGDTFRAGIVYGMHRGWDDETTIEFASAAAAVACTRFPSVLEPPGMEEIQAVIASRRA